MPILFNDFKKEYKINKKDIDLAVKRVLESGYFILGKEVSNFERSFAKYLGVKCVIGVANGMEALQISLLSIGVKPGDEVITASLSAAATSLAIKAVQAKPIFVDIDNYYHIDPEKIEKKISKKTKAIIPIHLYGEPVDMTKICSISKKYKIPIIEDCAQAHGAKFKGKKIGSFGITGCFSFYPTKNLGAYGDAGAIATNDTALADKIRMIRNYGQKNRYEHPVYGINSRLDEMQASILSVKLNKLDKENEKRNKIAKLYKKKLQGITQLRLPEVRRFTNHVYHLFVVYAEKRNDLQKYLSEKGIPTLIHYPIPIHKQKSFCEFNSIKLPATERAVEKILSLPIHPYMSFGEIRFICKNIKSFYQLG